VNVLGGSICELLGLDPTCVHTIEVRCVPDGSIVTYEYVREEDGRAVVVHDECGDWLADRILERVRVFNWRQVGEREA
jgi:hypothetical protein